MMPPIGYLTGGVDFSAHKAVLKPAVEEGGKVVKPEVALGWGEFVNTTIQFIIVAFCLFMVIKAMNTAKAASKRKRNPAPPNHGSRKAPDGNPRPP